MQCNKCGAEISADSKFCAECGNEILPPTQKSNEIICHICQCSNEINAIFCSGCGTQLKNLTKKCVKCGCEIDGETTFCGECGTNQNTYIDFEENEKSTKKKEKPMKRKTYVLIISILVLIIIILLAGVGGFFYDTSSNNNNEDEIVLKIQSESLKNTQTEKYEENDADEIVDDEQDDTDVIENEQTDIEENTENVILNIIDTPTYYRLESSEYSYYIDIPTHFVEDKHSDEKYRMFNAPDRTASIAVLVNENFDQKTSELLLQDMINNLGDSITYKANGDGWLAISASAEGTNTYHKIFVKDYIYTFRFTCDEKYVAVYKNYIEHIEDNFGMVNDK